MGTSDEAYKYLVEIKQVMQYLNVSTCDMEKGHLRCDANASVRPVGAEKLGTKAEVKNLEFLQSFCGWRWIMKSRARWR